MRTLQPQGNEHSVQDSTGKGQLGRPASGRSRLANRAMDDLGERLGITVIHRVGGAGNDHRFTVRDAVCHLVNPGIGDDGVAFAADNQHRLRDVIQAIRLRIQRKPE